MPSRRGPVGAQGAGDDELQTSPTRMTATDPGPRDHLITRSLSAIWDLDRRPRRQRLDPASRTLLGTRWRARRGSTGPSRLQAIGDARGARAGATMPVAPPRVRIDCARPGDESARRYALSEDLHHAERVLRAARELGAHCAFGNGPAAHANALAADAAEGIAHHYRLIGGEKRRRRLRVARARPARSTTSCTQRPRRGFARYAFVGSSNLSHNALFDGLEWNVRRSSVDAKHVIDRVSDDVRDASGIGAL